MRDIPDDSVLRICRRTTDLIDPFAGSVVKQCDGCDRDIWYDPNQKVIFQETHNLCTHCFVELSEKAGPENMHLIPPAVARGDFQGAASDS